MKLYNIKTILLVGLAILVASCSKVDFGDINKNPNQPSDPSSAGLLANAMRSVGAYVTSTTPNLYVQYLANGQYPDESRYVSLNWSYYGVYSGPLQDLKEVIQVNSESAAPNAKNTTAVAKLVTAYLYHFMTDRWGAVPYSEALQGLDNRTPKIDSQKDVYLGLFKDIDEAMGLMNDASGPDGDIIFGGDMARWKQFGNTLRVVMALRLSKRNDEIGGLAKQEFNKGIGGAITTAAENINYTFLSDDNNDNPWQDRFETRIDYILTDVLVNQLIGSGTETAPQDPRMYKYGSTVKNTDKYVGAVYGSGNDLVNDFSFITDDIIYNGAAAAPIFTAAQVQFSIAEAIELGWMSGDAADAFKKGIKASMNQWGVADDSADAFIGEMAYNGMESIAVQKWVALYLQGYEAWAEWRRIGGPSSIVKPAILLNGTDIPQRQGYSTSTPNINADNYNAAIAEQGADELDTKLWWAK